VPSWASFFRQMCARIEVNHTQVELRQTVAVWLEEGRPAWLSWTGFARVESLPRWLGMGAQQVDVPARRFAGRSTRTGRVIWEEIPLGLVMRGIIDSNSGRPLLKIVTRPATAAEYVRFEHPRMPIIELPRVSAERILPPQPHTDRPVIVQPALFAH
jgi:hypothetical protein